MLGYPFVFWSLVSGLVLLCERDVGQGQGTRTKDEGPRIKDQGTRNKHQGTRTKGQGTMNKAQGVREKKQGSTSKGQRTIVMLCWRHTETCVVHEGSPSRITGKYGHVTSMLFIISFRCCWFFVCFW